MIRNNYHFLIIKNNVHKKNDELIIYFINILKKISRIRAVEILKIRRKFYGLMKK